MMLASMFEYMDGSIPVEGYDYVITPEDAGTVTLALKNFRISENAPETVSVTAMNKANPSDMAICSFNNILPMKTPVSVTISPTTVSLRELNSTTQFVGTVLYDDGSTDNGCVYRGPVGDGHMAASTGIWTAPDRELVGPVVIEAWAADKTSIKASAVIDGVTNLRVLGKKNATVVAGSTFTANDVFYFAEGFTPDDFDFTSTFQGFTITGSSVTAEPDMDGLYSITATHKTTSAYTATVTIEVTPTA